MTILTLLAPWMFVSVNVVLIGISRWTYNLSGVSGPLLRLGLTVAVILAGFATLILSAGLFGIAWFGVGYFVLVYLGWYWLNRAILAQLTKVHDSPRTQRREILARIDLDDLTISKTLMKLRALFIKN